MQRAVSRNLISSKISSLSFALLMSSMGCSEVGAKFVTLEECQQHCYIIIQLSVKTTNFHIVINPRRACTVRVTVLSVCVCVCVCHLANSNVINVWVQSKIRIKSKCGIEGF